MVRCYLLLLFLLPIYALAQPPLLFPIIENGRMGYINSKGVEVIKPIYLKADEFSEGLAAARLNGTYGYIDHTGKFIIQPQYDYAVPFKEGLAVVYIDGKPSYINKKGEKAFECNYEFVSFFENGRAYVKTYSGKAGIINTKGKLVIDTIYRKIHPFHEGLAVVEGLYHKPYQDEMLPAKYETGIIDSDGKFIIAYGKYKEISDLSEGYFTAVKAPLNLETANDGEYQYFILDKTGQQLISFDGKTGLSTNNSIHNGLLKVHVTDTTGKKYWSSLNDYDAFMNLQGKLVINDANYKYAKDFSDNRTFVQNEREPFSLIDVTGKTIISKAFQRIGEQGFKNGLAVVQVRDKWGVVDTNGNYIIEPKFENIDRAATFNGFLIFREWVNTDSNTRPELAGISKLDGTIILKPIMQQFDYDGFRNGLLNCIVDNKLTYINEQGKIIWQQQKTQKELRALNIDYMSNTDFVAASLPDAERRSRGYGGWSGSENIPAKISKEHVFPTNSLSIIVKPELKDTFANKFYGITCFVTNSTKEEIEFNAMDSRLTMGVQALDAEGNWKDIEYSPETGCGNSYHTLFLAAQHYWSFVIPEYDGITATKLRVKLSYIIPNSSNGNNPNGTETTIYSNEFEGRINPGQLWRIPEYFPESIMNSYGN
jgi:hypothetical protein